MEKICAICQTTIQRGEPTKACPDCKSLFHDECWRENGGCAIYGCKHTPVSSKTNDDFYAETSYWGATTKNCPMCGETIRIQDRSCPYCHERFDTIAPMTQREIREGYKVRSRQIKDKQRALTIFICGLLGFTAPFNLIFGGMWFQNNRLHLKNISPLHHLLATIGLSISGVYALLFIVGTVFYCK